MKTVSWEKIDKFYLILAVVLIVMSVLFVFSVKGVFSMFLTAYTLDPNEINPHISVDKEKLDTAYNFVFQKNIVHLEPISSPPVEVKKTP